MSADPNALAPVSARAWPQPGALRGKKNHKTNIVPKTVAGWGSASLPFPPFHINRRAYKQMKIGRGGQKLQ